MAIADSVIDPGVEQWGDPAAGGNGSELVEGLLSLLDASRSQVQAILEQSVLDGTMLPDEVYTMFSLGEETASEALLLMEGGMYEEAAFRATEALQLYGDVLLLALGSSSLAEMNVTGDGSIDLQELWATLERGYAYLSEVSDTASQLAESGVGVPYVEEFIEDAEMYLSKAEAFLQQGDAEGAEGALDLVFQFLDSSLTFMQSLNEDLTAEKAAGFLANSERRLERLEEDILILVDPLTFEPDSFDALLQSLEDAHLKNRDLKDLLEGGDLSAMLGGLEGLQECSTDIFGILNGSDKDVAKQLRKAYKVELWITHHDDEEDPEGLEATTSDPEPGNDEDPKGGNSKGKPDKNDPNGNGGEKPSGSSEGNKGSGKGSPPNNSQGDKEKGNGKSNGGGRKKGHSKMQENE